MTTTFKELGLSEQLLDALEKKGFECPTPIQEQTIPLLLSDERDIIAQAQTGTGKTAAFGLPMLERLEPGAGHVQALVLTPTRELTIQVSDELSGLKGRKPLRITPIYGGQSIEKQRKQLKRDNDIIVGTPGRLIDHLNSRNLDLSSIQYLVLDEADEMLNQGFIDDIESILRRVNPDRKTLLFSATMPSSILNLSKKYMKETVNVKTKVETLADSLTEQIYFEVREPDKLEALCRIIDVEDEFYGFIFCRTKRDVDTISEKLIHRGYDAEAMHGDLSQFQRERVLQKFRKKICNILVVTDVASRGIDVKGLSHVINYAIPQDPESYVHRVGRTGRAGKTGTAITFITPSEFRKLMYIQKVSKKDISKKSIPDVNTIIEAKKKRITQKIQELQQGDLEQNLLTVAEEILSEKEPKEALAAVLKLAFDKEFSEDNYKDIRAVGKRDSHKSGRGRDRDRHDRRDRNDRHSIDDSGQARLFIAKGKKDRMTPKELVAYIEKKSGVFGKRIQGVQIYDKFSFVNTSFSDAEQIVQAFKSPGKRSLVEFAK